MVLVSRIPSGLVPTPHPTHFSNQNPPLQFKLAWHHQPEQRDFRQSVYLCVPTGYDPLKIHFVNENLITKKILSHSLRHHQNHTSPLCCLPSILLSPFSLAHSLSSLAVITRFHSMHFLCPSRNLFFSLKFALFESVIPFSILLWILRVSMEALRLSRAQPLIKQTSFPSRLKQLLSQCKDSPSLILVFIKMLI